MVSREDRSRRPCCLWLVMFRAAALALVAAATARAATATVAAAENDLGAPEQVHISLVGANHMRVSWITSNSSSPSIVEYGENSNDYNNVVQGENTSYSYIFYNSGLIHNVVLGPLEDNKVYYYRCGGIGSEYSFKTPPTSGSNVSITFVIVGDLGQTQWTISTLNHIQQANYDVLILPGDLSYADTYQPLWDSFGRLVEPLASSRPWMVTEGNHEIESVPLIENSFIAYNARWRMPHEESSSNSNLYYSFKVAGVHILMLGSYTDYDIYSSQYKWLQANLAMVDRKQTPWLIAVIHAPWYNSNTAHQGEGDGMMAAMEALLKEAQVDVIFAGHVHAYERTARVFQKNLDPCGIVHFTIGDGGNREGLARTFMDPKPEWSLYREASFGHGQFQVINATHAHWTWHRNQDDEQVVVDEVWLNSHINPSTHCIV